MARAASRGGEEPDAPALDPVPQELAAIVEARFTADGVSLTAHGPAAASRQNARQGDA
jgi:hypothetical protein